MNAEPDFEWTGLPCKSEALYKILKITYLKRLMGAEKGTAGIDDFSGITDYIHDDKHSD